MSPCRLDLLHAGACWALRDNLEEPNPFHVSQTSLRAPLQGLDTQYNFGTKPRVGDNREKTGGISRHTEERVLVETEGEGQLSEGGVFAESQGHRGLERAERSRQGK